MPRISLLPRHTHTQLSPNILSQVSWIKINHIADSLLKLHFKIGVHLINVEPSQLLTLVSSKALSFYEYIVSHCLKLKLNAKKLSRFQFHFPGLLETLPILK